MPLTLNIQKFLFRMTGAAWREKQLESGLIFGLVENRGGKLIAIYLAHGKGAYKKISVADARGSILIRRGLGIWSELVEFARNGNVGKLPYDYFFSRDDQAIFYSLDGEIFSFPTSDILEIEDATLKDSKGAGLD